MSLANRCAVAVVAGCGVLCAAFGALELEAWYRVATRLETTLLPGAATGYWMAAVTVLAGVSLVAVALGRSRLALPGGLLAFAVGVGSIVARLFAAAPQVAVVLQRSLPHTAAHSDALTRIAALQLTLLGASLVALGPGRASARRAPLVATLASALATLGIATASGHFTGADGTWSWIRLTLLPLETGLAFAAAGTGLLAAAWRESLERRPLVPRWLPAVVGSAGVTFTLVMWHALSVERPSSFGVAAPVPHTALVVGLVFTMLTALAVHWAATARLREREAREAFQKLAKGTGEWRLAEKAQRRSEERFQLVARATSDALWNWDLGTGDLWWSPGFYALFRYPEGSEQRGLASKTSRLHPADRERVMKSMLAAIEGRVDLWSSEYRFKCGDGTYAYVSDRAYILRDAAGRVERMFGSMIDFTARRQAEEERDGFFTLSPDALCIAGFDGYLKRINPTWTELLGYTEDELRSRPEIEFVHPDDRAATEESLKRIRSGGAVESFVNRYQHKDGSFRWLQWRARQVAERQIIYAFARDVTEDKRIESELAAVRDQALQSANAKSRFLANMSHEIRTPMNGVLGMCELLTETPLNPTQRRYAETIHSSADSLLTILDDILDFSKAEVGKLSLQSVPVDLRRLTEDILDLFARRAETKGIELAGLVRHDVPHALRGDPARLRQVMANLVGNAVKFTDRGLVALEASVWGEVNGRVVVRFEVRDTGEGISESGMSTLFASFSQVDSSASKRHGGTGLGLAISKQLVELMEGTIGVDSKPGRGSTFWFTVPFERDATVAGGEPQEEAPLAGRRVLVVQENETCRGMLRHVLESWKLEVIEAQDAGAALHAVNDPEGRGRIDFALIDLYLSDLDGLALGDAVRQLAGDSAPAVVLMTPIGTREEILSKASFAACLAKPVVPTQLLECLLAIVAAPRTPAASLAPAPAARADAARNGTQAARIEQDPRRGRSGGNVILVVDDNAVNLHVALGQLESHGYVADVVSSGGDALLALMRRRYDLVLMDCQMPEMDGFQATQEIRRREGSSRHTIVVAMTAYALEGDRQRCLAAGMDDHIGKPIRGAELDRVIRRWLKRAEEEQLASQPPAEAAAVPAREAVSIAPRERSGEGARQAAAEGSLVDMTLLRDASGDDPVRMRDLIALYFGQMNEQAPQLGAAIAAGASDEVRRIAHRCAGSSASCGMLGLVAPLRDLECMGKESRLGQAAEVFAELERRLAMAQDQVRTEMENPAAMHAAH